MSQELEDQLFDIFMYENKNWIRGKTKYDIETESGMRIDMDPEDAKNIHQVKSFTVNVDVKGVEYINIRKKRIEDP